VPFLYEIYLKVIRKGSGRHCNDSLMRSLNTSKRHFRLLYVRSYLSWYLANTHSEFDMKLWRRKDIPSVIA